MEDTQMTPTRAKKIVADAIAKQGLYPHKLSAKTTSFSDLGRGSRIFVKIHNWNSGAAWQTIEAIARVNGFSIE
jgi:hypothetical protein